MWRPKSGYPTAQMRDYHDAQWRAMSLVLEDHNQPLWQMADRQAVRRVLAQGEMDFSYWTPLNHICYLLEMNTWLKQWRIGLV